MNTDSTPHSTLPTSPSTSILPAPGQGATPDFQAPAPTPAPKVHRLGRPRVLDELKRHEICALVAAGCSLREAAKFVGCGLNTIRRELARNGHFERSLRSSQMHAQLSPLRAMQRAATKHWRAAAWMLERAYPERFAHREPAPLGARQARHLLRQIVDTIHQEIDHPSREARILKRLRPIFSDTIRAACDSRRASRELRQAIEFLDRRREDRDNHGEVQDT